MTMVHASLAAGVRVVIPWPANFNALVYVLGGEGAVVPSAGPSSRAN